MPATLTSTLGIALSSLQTSQLQIATTSHNLANVNSEGYTRQEVITAGTAVDGFGVGVSVAEVRRTSDSLLKIRKTEQVSELGYTDAISSGMSNLETIFGMPGADSSLENVMGDMFNQMNVLSNSPESSSLQLNALKTTEFVIDSINAISNELTSTAIRLDSQIDDEIITINQALENIFELNEEIVILGIDSNNGSNANDLIDERQRQINIVAERLNVNIVTDNYGRSVLTSETGRMLVGRSYVALERIPDTPYDGIGARSYKVDGTLSNTAFPLNISKMSNGSLKGMIDVRDTEIVALQAEIDELAATMITEFNMTHSQGSAVPPPRTLESGNGYKLSAPGADLLDVNELGLTASSSFDISIVDPATGQPIATTLAAGGGAGSINIPAAGPFTYADLAALINANPDVGGVVTASTFVDSDGNTQLRIEANAAGDAVVLNNNSGNPLGELGMNNFFTGTDAQTMAIREDIKADPALMATARMRESDGGLSFNDNRNIIELAGLADKEVSFDAAGGLGARNDSITGYYISISSNLAVTLKDNTDRQEFAQNIMNDLEKRDSSISGVNMDEELSNLIIFQNAYQASARLISIVDELFDSILNMV